MTTNLVADQLRAMLPPGRDAVEALPVFSNLGEMDVPLPPERRQRRMVVFGTRTWREAVYRQHADDLLAACRHLGIESVLDVGAPLPSPPSGLPIPFAAHGLLRVEDAPAVFGESLAGFFTYPTPYLGKSGIFAAYCAHGLVPVTTTDNRRPNGDGLRAGTHYLLGPEGGVPDEVARAAHAWYREHRLQVHADAVAAGHGGVQGVALALSFTFWPKPVAQVASTVLRSPPRLPWKVLSFIASPLPSPAPSSSTLIARSGVEMTPRMFASPCAVMLEPVKNW